MAKTIAQRLGNFVYNFSLEDVPIKVIEKAKTCLINDIGMGISCYNVAEAKVARELIKGEEAGLVPAKGSTLFCDGTVVSTMGAAFANSVLFTDRAQEDTIGSTHVGVVVIPAALAISEREDNSGRELLAATIIGYEIAGTLDKNLSPFTTPRGLRATAIFSIIGCAATASKLLRLSEDETINALGFAAGFAGGTLETFTFGTKEARFQAGVAAKSGILSALLAKSGTRAAPTAFEGKSGYIKALANTLKNSEKIGKGLGKSWEILDAVFKPYPVCVGNQTPTIATLELVRDNNIDHKQIQKIELRLDPYFVNYPGFTNRGPFHSIEATLMSAPFVQALACVDKEVTFAGLQKFDEPSVLEILKRVNIIGDDSLLHPRSRVEITMNDGSKYNKEMKVKTDYFSFDMERDIELVKRVTSEEGVSQNKVDGIISLVRDIDKLRNVKELIKLLVNCP